MAKSTRPTVRIHNIETDEVIDREMNDDEFAQYEAEKAAQLAKQAEAEAKAAEKQAILDRIGLTADELKMILG
jgi:signal-transduction protein with cAMP-binding, CBS, and nucleotidyltransferase domain